MAHGRKGGGSIELPVQDSTQKASDQTYSHGYLRACF